MYGTYEMTIKDVVQRLGDISKIKGDTLDELYKAICDKHQELIDLRTKTCLNVIPLENDKLVYIAQYVLKAKKEDATEKANQRIKNATEGKTRELSEDVIRNAINEEILDTLTGVQRNSIKELLTDRLPPETSLCKNFLDIYDEQVAVIKFNI
jgi:hypothetical protein